MVRERFPKAYDKNKQDLKQLRADIHGLHRYVKSKPKMMKAYLEMEKDFKRNGMGQSSIVGSVQFKAMATLIISMIPLSIPYAQSYGQIAAYLLKIMPFDEAYTVYKTIIQSEYMTVYTINESMQLLLIARIDEIMRKLHPKEWTRVTDLVLTEYLSIPLQTLFTSGIPESDMELRRDAFEAFLKKGAGPWAVVLMAVGQFERLNKHLDFGKTPDEIIMRTFINGWAKIYHDNNFKLTEDVEIAEKLLASHGITSLSPIKK